MIIRLKLIGNSAFTIISMLIISCSMCASTWSLKLYSEWTNLAIAATVIGGLVLFSWLIWAINALCKRIPIKEMHPKSRTVIEMLSGVLFGVWLYMVASPIVAIIWFIILVWGEIHFIKIDNSKS